MGGDGRSHGHAGPLDHTLASSAGGIRAVKLSLLGLGATALLQVGIYGFSESVALYIVTITHGCQCEHTERNEYEKVGTETGVLWIGKR